MRALLKPIITLTFFPITSACLAQQDIPACLDPKSKTCSEDSCLSLTQNLCWMNDYIRNAAPGLKIMAETFLKMPASSLSGAIAAQNVPWGAYYFPYHNGGICQRWQQSTSKQHFAESDTTLNMQYLKKLSSAELSKLSPALKFDLFLGDTTFIIAHTELERRSKNRALELKKQGIPVSERNGGFCNGARAAGVLTPEPVASIWVKSPIPGLNNRFAFTPSDIKALLAASFFHPQHADNFGDRYCPVDPATLDVFVRVMIDGLHRPFFVDADTTSNVDNKTVLKYSRQVLGTQMMPDGTKKATVILKLLTLAEFGPSEANKATKADIVTFIKTTNLASMPVSLFNNTARPKFQFYIYKYVIRYAKDNTILSGEWVKEKGYTRPDFAWIAWGEGNDDCSFYNNLNFAGDPHLSFAAIKHLMSFKK